MRTGPRGNHGGTFRLPAITVDAGRPKKVLGLMPSPMIVESYTEDEIKQRLWFCAIEWVALPAFISQPIAPFCSSSTAGISSSSPYMQSEHFGALSDTYL
jgi:hypothetical protein